MDILYPSLEQQPSPAPWLNRRRLIDAPALIEQVLVQKPEATIDEIRDQLAAWNAPTSGSVVAMWRSKLRDKLPHGEANRKRAARVAA